MLPVGKAPSRQVTFIEKIEVRVRQEASPARRTYLSLHKSKCDGGFTYVVVLIMLIALGLAAGTAGQADSQRMQAEREAELLFRGLAYQRAIKSYYEEKSVPQNARVLPRQLEDLLKDPRVQHRRHLRALYPDPFAPTGDNEGWRVLRAQDGGILGVASRSRIEARRKANFPSGLEGLAGARAYADWEFVFTPPIAPQAPAVSSGRRS